MSRAIHRRAVGMLVLAAVGLGACSDQGFTDRTELDVWKQNRRNELDLLVVIDNSCSMVQEQENLAGNFDALIDTFASAEVDWQIGVTTTDVEADRFKGLLISGDDEIIVRGPSGEVDRVEYDRSWVFDEGVALQLKPTEFASFKNLSLENWCVAANEYVEGSKGSPGAWNPDCDGNAVAEPELGPDAGPRAPRGGEIIVTEIMAAADGIDSDCEWFELTNISDHTLILDEVTISDEGNNAVAMPPGAEMAPHQALVVGRSLDTDVNCDVPVDIAATEGWALQDHVPVLDVETEDADERFAEMIAQGTQGSGIEHGLEGARLVFEEPYFSEQNQSWLREDAALAILVVSDEDDVSPHSVAFYERAYKETKGDQAFRQDGWFTLNAIVGTNETDSHIDVSCESSQGQAFYASRYIELAARTGGLVESICEEDFSPIVRNLGLSISGLELQFELSSFPVVDTLVVRLYEDRDEDSLVAELVRDVDYTYVAEGNYLLFDESQIPPPEYIITAEYRPLAVGSTVEAGESE